MAETPALPWYVSRPGSGEPPLPADTLSVSALARGIQVALREAFPRRVWVVGEAAELERNAHRQHWFFRLCETNPEDGKQYALSAVLWGSEVSRLFGEGGALDGVIEPRDGIEVRALCDVDFYPPHGVLRLVVRDIDPAYTLGKMALEKRRLVECLQKEGVLDRQRELKLEELPLRIGLITSENSAAYNDFVQELLASGLAFQIRFFDARMQGEQTVRTVVRGLDLLGRSGVDVIALIRGGGSTVDLAWFDQEEIVRAIAALRIPVLTGIGHEIDSSVSDLAAHMAFKTPTAVAAFLAEQGARATRFLESASGRLHRVAESPAEELEQLSDAVSHLGRTVEERSRESMLALRDRAHQFHRLVLASLSCEARRAMKDRIRLADVASRLLVRAERGVFQCRARVGGARGLTSLPLAVAASKRNLVRLSVAIRHLFSSARETLAAAAAREKLLDPGNVVRRGYAILRNASGCAILDPRGVRAGDLISAELRSGRIDARVERVESRKPENLDHGEAEDQQDGGTARGGVSQLEIW
ncbi:MAG: exodeoxyribonuclease VII large subunit [Planctomycetota bacterium]